MRHDPFTGVFNGAYINGNIRFNVQDAFLESDISDDGLTRAFTHMSLRCNPGAPEEVSKELMDQLLDAEPDIVQLDRQFKESRIRLRWEYGAIKWAPMQEQKEHEELGKQLRNATKSFRTEIEGANRKDYFYRIQATEALGYRRRRGSGGAPASCPAPARGADAHLFIGGYTSSLSGSALCSGG